MLLACFTAALLSCGGAGGEGDSSPAPKPFARTSAGLPSFTGSAVTGLIGIVVDSTTGSPIPGVTIVAAGLTTTSYANGNFAMPTIPTYAPRSRTVQFRSGGRRDYQ